MKSDFATKLAAGAVVGGTVFAALAIGSGTAQAEIDSGHYVGQVLLFGVIPTPEYNVVVTGNHYQQDYFSAGPQDLSTTTIAPTPDGGNYTVGATDPVSSWVTHDELHKTPTGYYGTRFVYGPIPGGNVVLTKTDRLANQPH